MSNAVGPIAAILVGVGVFLGVYFAMKKPAPEAAPEVKPAPKTDPVAPPDPNPPKADPEPKKTDITAPKTDPEPKATPLALLGKWKSSNAEPKGKGNQPTDVLDIAFARASGNVMLRTREAIQVHNVASGTMLTSLKADPNMSSLSADGKAAVVIQSSGTGVDIYSGEDLSKSGSWVAPKSTYHSYTRLRFSPGGTSFVLADSLMDADQMGKGYVLTTLSTSGNGTRWPNRLTVPDKELMRFGSVVAVPKFERAIYFNSIAKPEQPKVFSIDSKTSTPTPIKSITIMPNELSDRPTLELSADSTLLLARNGGEIQVVDWRADKLRLFLKYEQWGTSGVTFRHAALTPNSKYLVVVRGYPEFFYTSGPRAGQTVQAPTSIDLHSLDADKASAKPVATRTVMDLGLRNSVTALGVSRDGKAIAVAGGPEVRVFDFEAAFGIAPGKSLAPSAAEESLLMP